MCSKKLAWYRSPQWRCRLECIKCGASECDHTFRECIPSNNCLGEERTLKRVSPALVCCDGVHICLTWGPRSMSVWEDIRIMWDANRTIWYIWYSIHSLLVARRCSRDLQPSVWSMSDTLDVLWCMLVTHLAALRCTISSECFCLEIWGSPTVAAYSRCGRTSVLNSLSFVELDRVLMFLLRNASCCFALALTMSMCFPQVRSFDREGDAYVFRALRWFQICAV